MYLCSLTKNTDSQNGNIHELVMLYQTFIAHGQTAQCNKIDIPYFGGKIFWRIAKICHLAEFTLAVEPVL